MKVGQALIDRWKGEHGDATVVVRELAKETPTHAPMAAFEAAFSKVQGGAMPRSDESELFDIETSALEKADAILVIAPMYNFGVSSLLKTWIDHILVPQRTFKYTELGPVGLVDGSKKVFVVGARGGFYRPGTPTAGGDFVEPYLTHVFGFIGLRDIQFVNVEGVSTDSGSAVTAALSAVAQLRL